MAGVRNVPPGNVDDLLKGSSNADGDWDVPTLLLRHDAVIRKVLQARQDAQMDASRRKATFFQTAVESCVHLLKDGPIPGKLLAIEKGELRSTIKSLSGFLGFDHYYSGYVADSARLVIKMQEKP